MDQITVANLGVKRGGLTIYRKQAGGSWSFCTEGSSIALDERDDEEWRSWTTEPVAHLSRSASWGLSSRSPMPLVRSCWEEMV